MNILRFLFNLRTWLGVLAILLALAGGFTMYDALTPAPSLIFEMSTMTYNIGRSDLDPDAKLLRESRIANFISSVGAPDILFLQEVSGPNQAGRLAAQLGYEHAVYPPHTEGELYSGLAIMSRFPLGPARELLFGSGAHQAYGALAVEAAVSEHSITLCTLHLPPPDFEPEGRDLGTFLDMGGYLFGELFSTSARYDAAKALIPWLRHHQAPFTILGGDCNTFPLSRTARTIGALYDDALWFSLDYFRGSHTASPAFGPRIDFLFLSDGLGVAEAGVVRETVSDHYPVMARLGVKE